MSVLPNLSATMSLVRNHAILGGIMDLPTGLKQVQIIFEADEPDDSIRFLSLEHAARQLADGIEAQDFWELLREAHGDEPDEALRTLLAAALASKLGQDPQLVEVELERERLTRNLVPYRHQGEGGRYCSVWKPKTPVVKPTDDPYVPPPQYRR